MLLLLLLPLELNLLLELLELVGEAAAPAWAALAHPQQPGKQQRPLQRRLAGPLLQQLLLLLLRPVQAAVAAAEEATPGAAALPALSWLAWPGGRGAAAAAATASAAPQSEEPGQPHPLPLPLLLLP